MRYARFYLRNSYVKLHLSFWTVYLTEYRAYLSIFLILFTMVDNSFVIPVKLYYEDITITLLLYEI